MTEDMKKALKAYFAARRDFLESVRVLTKEVNHMTYAASDHPEEHDYLKYLATSFGAVTEKVTTHRMLTFDEWKQEFCGARRACGPEKDLDEV